MTEERFAQRIDRLVEDKQIRALLLEAEHLLILYLQGDDAIDLEPIVSAQSILHQTIALLPASEDQDKEYPISDVTRIEVQAAGDDVQPTQ